MNIVRRTLTALGLAAFGLLASCTEVDGQRITLRYDAAADTLRLLLHYDGIHEKEGDSTPASRQIPEFLEAGDLMLLDWFGHIDMKELREAAAKEETPPALREFLLCLTDSVKTTALGHYRDPAGRIGAVQRVEVLRASVFLRKANAALNEAVLHGRADEIWKRTAVRMRPGALEGRQWLFIDGHSVGITFAADPAEWARNRAEWVRDMMKESARSEVKSPPEADAPPAPSQDRSLEAQVLSLSPIALVETRESVTVRIGDPGHPSTLRFRLRESGEGSIDDIVKKGAPRDLDGALGEALLAGKVPEDPGLRGLLEEGPAEERARVLLALARSSEGEKRKAALDGLGAFASEWNREVGIPAAPETTTVETLGEWAAWYRAVLEGASR